MLRGLGFHRTGFAQALAAFALLALLVRALVPTAYMVAPSQDGRFITVTLCSAHNAASTLLDLATGELVDRDPTPQERSSADADSVCPFATCAALSPPEQPPGLRSAFCIAPAATARTTDVAFRPGLAAPPPWATGPPGRALI